MTYHHDNIYYSALSVEHHNKAGKKHNHDEYKDKPLSNDTETRSMQEFDVRVKE